MNAVYKTDVAPNGQLSYANAYELVSTGGAGGLEELDEEDVGPDAAPGSKPVKQRLTRWGRVRALARKLCTCANACVVITVVVLAAALGGLCVGGYKLKQARTTVVRTINVSFDSEATLAANATQALLVVEQKYATLHPNLLYFEPGAGFNFLISLYLVRDPRNLRDRTLLMKFNEDLTAPGGMQDGQVYYVSRTHRITCMHGGVPSIIYLPEIADSVDVTRTWRSIVTRTVLPDAGTTSVGGVPGPLSARVGLSVLCVCVCVCTDADATVGACVTGPALSLMFPMRSSFPFAIIKRHSLVPSPLNRLAAGMVTMIAAEEVDSTGRPIPHKRRQYFSGMTFYNVNTAVFEGAVRIRTCDRGGNSTRARERVGEWVRECCFVCAYRLCVCARTRTCVGGIHAD
jgi:hypothetical protein